MAKNNQPDNNEFEEVFEFSDMDFNESYDDDNMSQLMDLLVQNNSQQMKVASQLTQLIVANNPGNNTEDAIFALFKRATAVVSDTYNLNKLMTQLDPN